jgi:hypothetical protein
LLLARRPRARARARVQVHTNDVVCTVPPTFSNAYQHAGELVWLKGRPGELQHLYEGTHLYYVPMWWYSLQKLVGYGRRDFESRGTPGARRDTAARMAGRVLAAVPLLHAFVAGVNDHAPGDYYCERGPALRRSGLRMAATCLCCCCCSSTAAAAVNRPAGSVTAAARPTDVPPPRPAPPRRPGHVALSDPQNWEPFVEGPPGPGARPWLLKYIKWGMEARHRLGWSASR